MSSEQAACPLVRRLGTVVADRPGAPALTGGGDTLTYRQLWGLVQSWRARLLDEGLGARPGTAVAVVSGGPAEMVPAFLGIRAAGLVPLLVDTLIPPDRRDAMLRAARCSTVVELSSAGQARISAPDHEPLPLPRGAGYLTFSSGSQGPPKGIVGNAHGVAAFVDWERDLLGLDASCRGALLSAPSFDVVLRDMFLPLFSGGVLCVPGAAVRTDPTAVVDWLRENAVTVAHLVPSLSARWLAAAEPDALAALEWALFAGEPLYGRHVRRLRAVAPKAQVVNLYGPSETTLAKFWHLVDEPVGPGLLPVGRPLPGTTLRRAPVPEAAAGEAAGEAADTAEAQPEGVQADGAADTAFRITIETADGSLGYLADGLAESDAAALARRDGVTVFATQDRGRLGADGLLYVEGRFDGFVKRNGVMLDLASIAARALEEPEVAQAVCLQIDPDGAGEVVLAVEGGPGFVLRALTTALRRTLGPAMPNQVVAFAPLPMLPNGKTDRRRVREELEARRGPEGGDR